MKHRSRNKYKAKKSVCHCNHLHDSKKEAEYCNKLLAKMIKGKIKSFKHQVPFEIFPGFMFEGKKQRAVKYIADFVVTHNDGTVEIIDTKSKATITPLFRLKWKLLKYLIKDLAGHKMTIV